MRIWFLSILISVFSLGLSQKETKKEYYKNGELKTEKVFDGEKELVLKSYYKNGQLQYYKNNELLIVEEYYRNGQLSYVEKYIEQNRIEEIFSKKGVLMIRFINGITEFSLYENEFRETQKNENNYHGHGHGHGHSH